MAAWVAHENQTRRCQGTGSGRGERTECVSTAGAGRPGLTTPALRAHGHREPRLTVPAPRSPGGSHSHALVPSSPGGGGAHRLPAARASLAASAFSGPDTRLRAAAVHRRRREDGGRARLTHAGKLPPPQTQSLVAPPLARGLRAAAANPVLEVLGCGPESSFLSAGRSQAWASSVRERKAAGRLQEPQDSGDKGLTAGWPSDGGADRDPGHVEQTWGVSALPPGQPRKHALSHARGTASSTSRASCSEDGRLPAVERSANLPARSGGGTRHIGWTSGSPRTSTQSHG